MIRGASRSSVHASPWHTELAARLDSTKKRRQQDAKGEVGILRYVHGKDPISNKCFLVIEHDKEHYVGCLIFDDVAFCSQISRLLRDQIGHSVREIGDLDLSYTL